MWSIMALLTVLPQELFGPSYNERTHTTQIILFLFTFFFSFFFFFFLFFFSSSLSEEDEEQESWGRRKRKNRKPSHVTGVIDNVVHYGSTHGASTGFRLSSSERRRTTGVMDLAQHDAGEIILFLTFSFFVFSFFFFFFFFFFLSLSLSEEDEEPSHEELSFFFFSFFFFFFFLSSSLSEEDEEQESWDGGRERAETRVSCDQRDVAHCGSSYGTFTR